MLFIFLDVNVPRAGLRAKPQGQSETIRILHILLFCSASVVTPFHDILNQKFEDINIKDNSRVLSLNFSNISYGTLANSF